MIQPGKVLGPFRIEGVIGSGAMGTVYRAVYTETGKPVAIKIIALGLAGNESALARFEREADILKQLKHPHIVRLIASGRYKKTPFIAMEFVEGHSLEDALERRGRLTWEEVARLGKQLCLALQHAHEKGIIHRDLKPSNLMVLKDGTLKLADFGIAKDTDVTALTGNNSTVGTAAYMSPEQCRGERNLTAKSDLYSLGIVFYELLTGVKPFQKESPVDMFLAHVNDPFERPSRRVLDIPSWLDTLVCQLMEKKPEYRPLNAAIVGQALDEVLAKVGEQRSAGMELATGRDRNARSRADEADRDAARTLRSAATGKRIRKKAKPLYENSWLIGGAAFLLLAGFAFVIYLGFRPPGADTLYARANTAVKAGDKDAARAVVRQFAEIYPTASDRNAKQMQEWLREFEVEQMDRGLFNRFRMQMKSENENWALGYSALRSENSGELAEARKRWHELLERFPAPESLEDRTWVWLAAKKSNDIDELKTLEMKLQAVWEVPDAKAASDAERRSAEALRYERFGDLPAAIDSWGRVREDFLKDFEPRRLVVLAASKVRELKPKAVTGDKEVRAFRLELIKQQMASAEQLAREAVPATMRKAHDVFRDVVALYEKDPDPNIAPLANRAAARMREIPRPPEPVRN